MTTRFRLATFCLLGLSGIACSSSTDESGPNYTHPAGVLDAAAPTITGRPFGVAVSRNGLIYVPRLDAEMISVLDASLTVIDSIDVGSTPTGVVFSKDGTRAYVTNQGGPTLGVINVAAGEQVDEVPVSASPFVPAVSPSGNTVYVTSGGANVYLVNRSSGTVTDSIEVGAVTNGIAFHPKQDKVYFSSPGGTISEYGLNGDSLRTFTPGGAPQGVAVSPDGTELYVANENGWLEIFQLSNGSSVKVTLDSGGFGLALTPDGEFVYVSEPGVGKVQIVSVATRNVVGTLNVGGTPRRIAFTRTGEMAVVANEAGYVNFVK